MFKSPEIHRTPLYRAKAAYRNMLNRCENKDGKNSTYLNVKLKMSLGEWLEWSIPRYKEFIEKYPNEIPSVSRLHDIGDYELNNLSIIPLSINSLRERESLLLREDGTKLCGRCRNIFPSYCFWKDNQRPDKLRKWCIACVKGYNRSRGVIDSVSDF